jgi:hypothetical protein
MGLSTTLDDSGCPLLEPTMSRDLTTQLKINSASMDNDATGCYDRSVVALGMIGCHRLGMPKNVIRTHAKSLRLMKYAVKTIYDISAKNYTGVRSSSLCLESAKEVARLPLYGLHSW